MVGAKERETNLVSARTVEHTDRKTLQGFVCDRVDEDAVVYTDDAAAYNELPHHHESVRHSVGEYVRDMAHTNGIESFWALMKRGLNGTYHHISVKHMYRYMNEFAGRHNSRPANTERQMSVMAHGMLDKTLRYQDLIQ